MPVDVSVIEQTGIPENALFSIRAGPVRRQAPIKPGKPYRFPKIGIEESPVKIDIFQPIGTAYVVMKPGEERYQAVFQGAPHAMSCEIEMREVDASVPEVKDTDPPDTTDSKAYLEKHGILSFVQAVLQTVVKEKPDDPYMHIARHFLCGYDPADLTGLSKRTTGSPSRPTTAQVEKNQTCAAASSSPQNFPRAAGAAQPESTLKGPVNVGRDLPDLPTYGATQDLRGTGRAGSNDDTEVLRGRTRDALGAAQQDGRLANHLGIPVDEGDPLCEIRGKAQESLLRLTPEQLQLLFAS